MIGSISERMRQYPTLRGALRWGYQPIKQSITLAKSAAAAPRRERVLRHYLQRPGFKGLHFGCGPFRINGWLNTDMLGTPGIDFPLDLERPLPLPDRAFDAVYSSEVIEHIRREKVPALLLELRRILKPGGVMRLTTPDMEACCQLYLGTHKYPINAIRDTWREGQFSNLIWMNTYMRDWGHQWVWDFPALSEAIERAGFVNVNRCEPQITKSRLMELSALETRYGAHNSAERWAPTMIVEATGPPS